MKLTSGFAMEKSIVVCNGVKKSKFTNVCNSSFVIKCSDPAHHSRLGFK
jgi:hypothetical protein